MWKRRKACCRSFSLLQKFTEKQKDDNKIFCLLSWEWWSKTANNNDTFGSMVCGGEGSVLVRAISSSSGSAAARRPFYFFVAGQRQWRSDQCFVLWLIILRFELGKCACRAWCSRFSCSRAGLRLRLFLFAGNFLASYCKNDAERFLRAAPTKVCALTSLATWRSKKN